MAGWRLQRGCVADAAKRHPLHARIEPGGSAHSLAQVATWQAFVTRRAQLTQTTVWLRFTHDICTLVASNHVAGTGENLWKDV
jgi:hypothetical protein